MSHPEKPVRPSNMLAPTSLKSKQLQKEKKEKKEAITDWMMQL